VGRGEEQHRQPPPPGVGARVRLDEGEQIGVGRAGTRDALVDRAVAPEVLVGERQEEIGERGDRTAAALFLHQLDQRAERGPGSPGGARRR
jgi:hypothetical protein